MKIAYIASVGIQSLGVMRKVLEQTSAWNTLGHEARLFCLSPLPPKSRYALWRRCNLFNPRLAVLTDVKRFKPDLIYWREEDFSIFTLALLFMFAQKTVIEINSNSKLEGRLLSRNSLSHKFAYVKNILTQPFILRAVLGLVCMSAELALAPEFTCQPNRFVSPNGICLARRAVIKKPNRGGPIRIVFFGSPGQPWHGVDKLPALAKVLGSAFQFHVAGPNIKEISSDGNIPGNIIVHGYLDESACAGLMADSHIGMSTMALHRKNIDEIPPLKIRDYIAAGLPVIIPHKDPAFAETTPEWVLPLPNREDVFENMAVVEELRAFCEAQRDRVVTHYESRPYIEITDLEAKKLSVLSRWLRLDEKNDLPNA